MHAERAAPDGQAARNRFRGTTTSMNRTRRNINGRKQMATDWRKPSNLPDDWK